MKSIPAAMARFPRTGTLSCDPLGGQVREPAPMWPTATTMWRVLRLSSMPWW